MSLGDDRSTAWFDRRVAEGRTPALSPGGTPVDRTTGLQERRPGQVYMQPYNQWGAPVGWISGDEFEEKYHRGWNWKQVLAASAPFLAGGIGALAGGGSAAANGGIYGGAGLNSGPVAVTASTGTPIAATAGATTAGTGAATTAGAAGAAAKGAGMGFGIKDAVQFAPLIASLFSSNEDALPPQNDAMNELIGMQTARMKQADPLYQAILAMAMGLAPRSARGSLPQAGTTPGAPPVTHAVPRGRL